MPQMSDIAMNSTQPAPAHARSPLVLTAPFSTGRPDRSPRRRRGQSGCARAKRGEPRFSDSRTPGRHDGRTSGQPSRAQQPSGRSSCSVQTNVDAAPRGTTSKCRCRAPPRPVCRTSTRRGGVPPGDHHRVEHADAPAAGQRQPGARRQPAAQPLRPAPSTVPDVGGEHPLALPLPVDQRRPHLLRRRLDVHAHDQLRHRVLLVVGGRRPGSSSALVGPRRLPLCGRPDAAAPRRATISASRSSRACGELLEQPVDLGHPVAAEGHRDAQRPDVVPGDRPVVGQLDRRAVQLGRAAGSPRGPAAPRRRGTAARRRPARRRRRRGSRAPQASTGTGGPGRAHAAAAVARPPGGVGGLDDGDRPRRRRR